MSIEPGKVWQVIQYIDNINSSGETATTEQVRTIVPHQQQRHENGAAAGEDGEEEDFDEEEEDSYNHLIEEDEDEEDEDEEEIISYDSESEITGPSPLMESPTTIPRPTTMVLDLATNGSSNGRSHHELRPELHQIPLQHQQHLQGSPRLVYVKDHVITVNRPMVEDLSRMLSSANTTMVNMSTVAVSAEQLNVTSTGTTTATTTTTKTPAANDEELTSLTWLQDKNLIQGINLTTPKKAASNGSGSTPQTENAVTISSNCDKQQKQQQIVTLPPNGQMMSATENGGVVSPPYIMDNSGGAVKTIAISELASKILGSTNLPPSISHLLPAKGVSAHMPRGEQPTLLQQQQHVHKKYRREEHVKISKQQQQQQQQSPQQMQQHLQLTPNHSSSSHSPYSDRSMSSRKYSEESLSYHHHPQQSHHQSPGNRNGSKHGGGGKQKHPINVPYNPLVHISNKPPLSFSSLIFMAIENATEKALPVKEIYAWIVKHFPYFKTAPTGWKNSVRHNLSLNKCFQKVEKAPHMGKGSLWKVEQQYRQVLMQALTRSPYHQFAGNIDRGADEGFNADTNNNNMLMCNSSPSSSTISSTSSSLSTSPTGMDPHHNNNNSNHHHHPSHQSSLKMANGRPFDPVLFPYLSKEISKLDTNNNNALYANSHYNLSCVDSESESTGYYENSVDGDNSGHGYHHRFSSGGFNNFTQYPYDSHVDNSTDNMDDVNAATAMLALKHGSKIFDDGIRNGHPVITSSPSEDHTYSAGNDNGEETTTTTTNGTTTVGSSNGVEFRSPVEQSDIDYEEQRKKAEGVDALLNLAGFASHTTSQILMKRRASSDNTMNGSSSNSSNSMDCNSSAIIFSSPSPTKRSKTRYLQSAV